MIQIENLSKSFGSNQVLNDISLTLEKGKIYGIVGENGAGKTTFFKCIAGLETHKGKIKSEFTSLKDHLGFLQTNPFFFSKITGKEYLELLCHARNIKGIDFDARNVFDLPLNQYAVTYSTGMKKKLAIMGILMLENDFFIWDEPFNGVDIQSNIIITEIIHRLKALEKTMIISSHIFSTLKDTCDEIHLLKKGKIVRKVNQSEFDTLEQEMKDFTIGNSLDKLKLA
jgi:ABC-2 type transport system ATP-binding protein